MSYFHIDLGMFTTQVKLCFDQVGLDKILDDHSIDLKISAFDNGCAETHYLTDGREGIVIVLIDLDACDHDIHYLQGVVAHESMHVVCRVFEHIGEKISTVGEEVLAYTLEHIVKQISKATSIKLEKRDARETGRSVSKQAGKTTRRTKLQMDKQRNGSAGSDSPAKRKSVVRGTKDGHWDSFFKTEAGVQPDQPAGTNGVRITKQGGHR